MYGKRTRFLNASLTLYVGKQLKLRTQKAGFFVSIFPSVVSVPGVLEQAGDENNDPCI